MIEILLQGILLGGLYTLFALGPVADVRRHAPDQHRAGRLHHPRRLRGRRRHHAGGRRALRRRAGRAAAGLRLRLRAAALRAQRHARQGPAALAGRDLRALDRDPEPAAGAVLGRPAIDRDRRPQHAGPRPRRLALAGRAAAGDPRRSRSPPPPGCNGCSRAPRSAAPSAPCRTIARSPSSWGWTRRRSMPSPPPSPSC